MVGRVIQTPKERTTQVDSERTVLHFKMFLLKSGNHSIQDIHLQVRSGEIVGVAGVEGNGQDVLIRALFDRHAIEKNSVCQRNFASGENRFVSRRSFAFWCFAFASCV